MRGRAALRMNRLVRSGTTSTSNFSFGKINRPEITARFQTTSAANQSIKDDTFSKEQIAWNEAKPFTSIPSYSFIKIAYEVFKNPELKKYHKLGKEMHSRYGDIFYLKGINYAFVRKVEDVKTLLAADGKLPVEPGFDFFQEYRKKFRQDLYPQTRGLLGSHGEDWYKVRTLVQQDMLRPKSAMYYLSDITDICKQFTHLVDFQLKQNNNVIGDVTPILYRFALEATGTIFLDHKIGCLEPNLEPTSDSMRMIDCVNVVLGDAMFQLLNELPLYRYFPTKPYRDFDRASTELYNISKRLIDEAMKKFDRQAGSDARNPDELSVLEKFIQRCGPDSHVPLVMAMDALMAGIDTTGNQAAFLFYHLATNPEKQEKLFQEIVKVLGDGPVTESGLNQLKYLRAFLQESQRLLPAVGGLSRTTQKDIVLAGYQIPAGTNVNISATNIMRSEEYFNRPFSFEPERWLRERQTRSNSAGASTGCPQSGQGQQQGYSTIVPYSFIPFSHGPRMCIGRRFAELELQVLTIETVRKYQLSYGANAPPLDMQTPFVNRPDGPVKVTFKKR